MKERRPQTTLLLLFLLLAVALLVMFLLRDMVRQNIVIPLYYFFWLMDLLVRSVPQSAIWMVLVAVGMLFALRALVHRPRRRETIDPITPRERSSRFQFWRRTFLLLRASIFSLEYSSYELRRLLLNVLSNQENLTFSQVESLIENGTIPTPPAVRELVLKRQVGSSLPLPGGLRRSYLLLRERFFPYAFSAETSPLDNELEIILQYIESLLEV